MTVTTTSNYTASVAALVTVDGGTGGNGLSMTSNSPGAVIRRTVTSATSGVLSVSYPAPGLPSGLGYQNSGIVFTTPPVT